MAERKKTSPAMVIVPLAVVVILVLIIALIINHNNKSSSLTANQRNSDKQLITTNWKTFFAYKTPLTQREQLLQDGTKFSQIIQSEFAQLGSLTSSAVVNTITLSNSTTAKVNYTVDLSNKPVLPNEIGQALFVNNAWLVSDSTLCGLLSQSGLKPTVCQNL